MPVTVSAFSSAQLAASGVADTLDLASVVPGLVFNVGVGLGSPYLRGVGTVADGVGQENPVAIYVDGIYQPSKAAAIDSFSDVDRVEVLKGPQGTLFGRNATGGLISVITKDPSSTLQGDVKVGYGTYNTAFGDFYVTGPVANDLTGSLTGYFSHQTDGFGKNEFTDHPINRTEEGGVRAKVLFKPTDRTRITLTADYSQRDSSIGVAYRPIYGDKPAFGPLYTGGAYDVDENINPFLNVRDYGAALKIEQRLDWVTFNSITSFRKTDYHLRLDEVYEPVDAFVEDIPIFEDSFSQEFQAVGEKTHGLQWQLGTFLYFENSKQAANLQGFVVPGPTLQSETAVGEQPIQSYAVYGQATQDLPEHTRLTIGLRYTYEEHQLNAYNTALALNGVNTRFGNTDQGAIFQKPTWRFALDHDFTSDVLGYVSYNRGFASGLFNALAPTTPAVQPEILDAYEVGLKSTLLARRLSVNISGFYYKYNEIQLSKFVNGIQLLNNAASAQFDGVDLDFRAAVTPQFHVSGGVEYLKAFFLSYPDAPIAVPLPSGGNSFISASGTGNELADAPHWTPNITGTYDAEVFQGQAEFAATYSYNSGYYAEADDEVRQKGYSLVNATASWSPPGSRFKLSIFGKNLANQFYAATLTNQGFATVIAPAPPRTVGASIDVKF